MYCKFHGMCSRTRSRSMYFMVVFVYFRQMNYSVNYMYSILQLSSTTTDTPNGICI